MRGTAESSGDGDMEDVDVDDGVGGGVVKAAEGGADGVIWCGDEEERKLIVVAAFFGGGIGGCHLKPYPANEAEVEIIDKTDSFFDNCFK